MRLNIYHVNHDHSWIAEKADRTNWLKYFTPIFLMMCNFDWICQLSWGWTLFSNINFFAYFQLQAIIILAVLLSLNKQLYVLLISGKADFFHTDSVMILTLTLHSVDQHCWTFWGKTLSWNMLEQKRFQESGRELFFVFLFIFLPSSSTGELNSPGKVLGTGSQSLIEYSLAGN